MKKPIRRDRYYRVLGDMVACTTHYFTYCGIGLDGNTFAEKVIPHLIRGTFFCILKEDAPFYEEQRRVLDLFCRRGEMRETTGMELEHNDAEADSEKKEGIKI